MGEQRRPSDVISLRLCWSRWTAIVEWYARQRRAGHRVPPAEYERLHQELVRDCQALAATADGPRQEFYRDLEGLLAPWMTLAVLEHAEHEVLADLLRRCRKAEDELSGPAAKARRRAAPLVKLLAAWAVLVLAAAAAIRLWRPVREWGEDWLYPIWYNLKHRSDTTWVLAAAAVLGTIGAMYLVWRVRRN